MMKKNEVRIPVNAWILAAILKNRLLSGKWMKNGILCVDKFSVLMVVKNTCTKVTELWKLEIDKNKKSIQISALVYKKSNWTNKSTSVLVLGSWEYF